jgi:hypothetical protein
VSADTLQKSKRELEMIERKLQLATLVFSMSIGLGALAADLPRVQPEEVGFSAKRLAHIDGFYANEVNKGELAGIVTLVARHGKIAYFNAVGYADIERRQKMETDTICRLYGCCHGVVGVQIDFFKLDRLPQPLDEPSGKASQIDSHGSIVLRNCAASVRRY